MVLDFLRSSKVCTVRLFESEATTVANPTTRDSNRDLRPASRNHFFGASRATRSRQRSSRLYRFDQRGFGTLGASLALLAAFLGILLACGMSAITKTTATQVDFDRCSGKYVIQMRAAAVTIEKSYERLDEYRVGVLGICAATLGAACPEAIKVFNQIASIERSIQKATQVYWQAQSLEWKSVLGIDCHLPLWIMRSNYPQFPFEILKEGSFSLFDLKASSLRPRIETHYRLRLWNRNFSSTAELTKEIATHAWTVYWTE